MRNNRVVIDTDPGLDDAVAILLALTCGQFEVAGITTVSGNIGLETVTRNAGRLLALAGRGEVPVIAGASAPLVRAGINEAAIHGDDGLGGVVLPEPEQGAETGGAVAWLGEMLGRERLDIFALGPLTNIARLVEDRPQAALSIGKIIAMGGCIDERGNVGPRSEFNFAADPEAVDIVLRAGIELVLVPLDVTRKVRADGVYLNRLRGLGTVAASACADLIAAYFLGGTARESRPLHDPCVVLLAMDGGLFTLERMALAVDLSAGEDAGALVRDASGVMVDVAMAVDSARVLDALAAGLGARAPA